MTPSSTPKRNSSYLDSSKSGSGWRFSSLHENPVKGWREGADPRGHCHRLIGRLTTHLLASALGFAHISQPSTMSDCDLSRWQVSWSSHNRPGPKRFDDRDCIREGSSSLSTDARSHFDHSSIASVVCNGAPAGDIARWTPLAAPTCREKASGRHLC